MSRLDPPIDVIRSALFGAIEEATSAEVLPSASIAAEETVELPMPDSLKSAIAQALAADRAYANLPPETGQVRILRAIPGGRAMARPLGILLDRKETRGTQLWRGWMVSPDADYAGDTDLVLDEGDEPFDPIASMVQAWNPVRAMIARSAPVAAVLSQEKMSVVYILSGEAKGAKTALEEPPRPGLVAGRDFAGDAIALTGTPIAKSGDPRAEYREIYQKMAQELTQASERAASTAPGNSFWQMLRGWFAHPAWAAVLATVVVIQFGVIGLLMNGRVDETAELRSIPPAPPGPRLRVHFNPNVAQKDVHEALRSLGAQIIAGPDENGFFVLLLPQSLSAEQGVGKLRQMAGLADSVEVLDESRR